MCGAIEGAFTGGMNSPHCFVAGTLICTVDGEVPIEDIQVGDYVLAENPDTGEIDYKPVLETYEHDTYDVVYLTIDGEEFITTEGHPFYTLERGFVKAGELRYSDTLVDAKGNKLYLEKKNKEHLAGPVTVYNFAVEDYHTYFVGENGVLVHNKCGLKTGSEYLDNILDDAIETTNSKGKVRNFEVSGGWNKLLEDFSNLKLLNVQDISTSYGPGKIGFLENGIKIVARQGSNTLGPTLEVVLSNSRVIKIRY